MVKVRLTVAAGVLAAGLMTAPLVSSAAAPASGYYGAGSASGGRISFTVPGFAAVEEVVDAGGPVAQAVLDSQTSAGYAALPHPGDVVLAGPGLFNAVTGMSLPGGYPFYVSASHPTSPEGKLDDPSGTYHLGATANATASSAEARFAPSTREGSPFTSGGANASSTALNKGDAVTITAESRDEALTFGGGALRIGSIRSSSVTVYDPTRPEPTSTAETVVEGGSAGPYAFSYGPRGLVVAGGAVPVPPSAGLDQLNAALAPAGISIRIVKGEALTGGSTADIFQVSVRGKSPQPGIPDGIIQVRFGGATTTVTRGTGVGPLPEVTGGVDDVPAPGGVNPVPDQVVPAAPLVADPTGAGSGGLDGAAFGSSLSERTESSGAQAALDSDPSDPSETASPATVGLTTASPARSALPAGWNGEMQADGLLYLSFAIAGAGVLALLGLWLKKGVLRA
jgi:hypothetical protein